MTNLSLSASLWIKHDPYGEYHPYEPLPSERSPRDPASGEAIMLGVETGLATPAEAVWCIWHVEGRPAERVEGISCGKGEASDHWQVRLPAFNGGEIVRYRLYAQSGEQQVETPEFVFYVAMWVEVLAASALEDTDGRFSALLFTSSPELSLRLEVDEDQAGALKFRFSMLTADSDAREAVESSSSLEASWGGLRLSLESSPLRLELRREGDGLVLQTTEFIQVLARGDGSLAGYRFGFASPADEAFYGFGERFNALDQRGSRLLNRVYAQYIGQGKRSYIPIPFFISSRGYSIWLCTERQAEFDLAAVKTDRWTMTVEPEENGCLEMVFFLQTHPRDQVQAFTARVGRPLLPPHWAFGLWISSNDWNSQVEVLQQLKLALDHQIPVSVVVIEAWSDEITFYIWNDAQYRLKPAAESYSLRDFTFPAEGRWPDPKAMIDEIHNAGARLVLWQIPVLKRGIPAERLDETQKMADQDYAVQQGFVVRAADGSPHQVEASMAWFPGSLVIDFTHPEAERWWMEKRAYLLSEMGVDGFKTDGGEHIWRPDTLFSDGSSGARGINRYPVDYLSAYRCLLDAHRGSDLLLFSRAGYTGAQSVSLHWAGDEASTWEAFRATLNAMLNAGICGVSFIGWDIAGFAGPLPSSELYLRAAAFSVFCPIFQFHSDGNARRIPSRDRTPWNIQEQSGDERVIPIFRKLTNLRLNLIPYILEQARLSSQSGLPMMRALPLEFPGDLVCRDYPGEYLFGEALLVAPVLEEGREDWTIYLPAGRWRDLWSGEVEQGPCSITLSAPLDCIPVFQREGSIVLLNLGDSLELGSPVKGSTGSFDRLSALIFPGKACRVEVAKSAGGRAGEIQALCTTDNSVQIILQGLSQPVELLVAMDAPRQVFLNGEPLGSDVETPASWRWLPAMRVVHIHLPTDEGKRLVILS